MRPLQRTRLVLPLLLAASALGTLPVAAQAAGTQGSGRSTTEVRAVAEFQAIALRGAIDLDLKQGSPTSVQVQADDNLLPLLESVVEPGRDGAVLHLRWKSGERISTRSPARVSVTVPELKSIAAAGAGDIRIDSFKTPSFKLSISGSGDARMAGLQTDDLTVGIAGSGDVRGTGQAAKLSLSISGSGDVKLGELRADEVTVRIAGSGDAEVNAQKTLQVSIAGSGDVLYSGEAVLKSSVAGSGSVRKKP